MKVSFTFDGEVLKLRLDVEDKNEKAMAALMESFTIADVRGRATTLQRSRRP